MLEGAVSEARAGLRLEEVGEIVQLKLMDASDRSLVEFIIASSPIVNIYYICYKRELAHETNLLYPPWSWMLGLVSPMWRSLLSLCSTLSPSPESVSMFSTITSSTTSQSAPSASISLMTVLYFTYLLYFNFRNF